MNKMERIKLLLKAERVSVTAFAKRLGMSQPSVNRYIQDQQKPTWEFAEKILSVYPEVSAEWLMRGVGSMYNEAPGMASEDIHASMGEEYYNKLVEEMEQMKQKINQIQTKVG